VWEIFCGHNLDKTGSWKKRDFALKPFVDEMVKVVRAKNAAGTMIKVIGNTKERLPIDEDIAINFIKSGLIPIIRHELNVRVRYIDSDDCFELVGHRQAIDHAKYRLLHASNSKDTAVQVPSEKDTCGLIIGTKGTRMKRIKARLQINHGIGVKWDEESKEIVLTSTVPLATESKS
jgi:hypothetical protein